MVEHLSMSERATGTFEVSIQWQPPHDAAAGISLTRATLDKHFHGDLEGSSRGEMLSAVTGVPGSAGYVAIERVTGILGGREGSFVLQHSGTVTRGDSGLVITVVPDSGSGALAGISGQMKIDIVDGKHLFTFDYRIGGAV
jgi:Protein of unknown function (DUF3224)